MSYSHLQEHDRLRAGIRLFNDRRYFECHEILEEEWTPEHGPRRLFLQSLIHIAVAFVHMQRGNSAGAIGQLRKGLRKLAAYLPSHEGVDTARLYRDALFSLNRIEAGAKEFEYLQIKMTPPMDS